MSWKINVPFRVPFNRTLIFQLMKLGWRLVEYNVNISSHENIRTIERMKNIHYLYYKTYKDICTKYIT